MVHQLKSPHQFPGLSAQGNYRIRPSVIAGPQSTVVVWAGASGRNEEQITFVVHGHDGPCVAGAALPLLCRAVAGGSLAARVDGIPTPAQSPAACVESPDHSARHIHAIVVVDRR